MQNRTKRTHSAYAPRQQCAKLVNDRSNASPPISPTTTIAASEAKAKFSELLNRVQRGEGFSITLHGEETAKLIPSKRLSREEIQDAISQMKASRSILNPPRKQRINIKDLINEGRR